MSRWTILAVVVCFTVCHEIGRSAGADIGVRSLPAKDSAAMTKFKKSLTAEEQSLLKRHESKTRFIQALLDKSKRTDKRDEISSGAKVDKRDEHSELDCCSCNPGSEGCYHPSDVKRSRIIRCCIPGPSAVKRDETDDVSPQDVLDAASAADKALMERHKSKINNLVEAAKQPESQGDSTKRDKVEEKKTVKKEHDDVDLSPSQTDALQKLIDSLDTLKGVVTNLKEQKGKDAKESAPLADTNPGGRDIMKRFLSDVSLAKKYGVKLDDLLANLKRRAVVAEKQSKH